VVHLVSYAAFAVLTSRVFASAVPSDGRALFWFAIWLASGVLVVLTLFRWLLGPALEALAGGALRSLLAGIPFGVLAWYLAAHSIPLWNRLARGTLLLSAALLRPFSDAVIADYSHNALGLGRFTAVIASYCSGIEGIGLIAVFVCGYLYRFRAELRFPNALILVPAGMGAAWFANSIRIAAIVGMGAWVSPDIAYGAFHSKAGWLFFCGLALGVVVLSQRSPFFFRGPSLPAEDVENPTAAYCMPLLALLAVGMLTSAFSGAVDFFYPLRLLAAVAAVLVFRDYYKDLLKGVERGVPVRAIAIGAAVFGLWWLLSPPADAKQTVAVSDALDHLDAGTRALWLSFRVLGSVLVVPCAEELAFRGYLQRRLLAEDFTAVPLQRFGWASLTFTSLAFGLLHVNWLAAIIAGAMYSAAVYHRGRLSDAVIAHATTNALLASWVIAYQRWDLW
jgi:exosortase E/protease (VPEID-CTERM system)